MPPANPYDTIAYPSDSYRLTHPDRLACHGRLFGLASAAPQQCRYLELGCGSATNLLAMASQLPAARFFGIDLAAAPVAEAQRHAAELRLANVTFLQADIAELPGDLGEFDYIAAHGVFSWVPETVRHALLAVCARHLTATGVAYISYNAYPGCHVRQMVREMLSYHVRFFTDPAKKQEQSRSLMRFLVAAKIAPEPYASLLRSEAQRVVTAPLGLTVHDDLSETNQPYYFHEFISQAQGHQLQFLAEAALADMSGLAVDAEVRPAFEALDHDLLQKEQYLDFMRGRCFRQTLLCRAGIALERAPAAKRQLGSLCLACDATLDPRTPTDPAGDCTYRRGDQLSITLSSPLANGLVQDLIAAWPSTATLSGLQARIQVRLPADACRMEELTAIAWDLAHTGLIEVRFGPAPGIAGISDHPCVSRVARWQARHDRYVTNLHHDMVKLDGALLTALVPLLDGTRSIPDLTRDLSALVAAGDLAPPPGIDPADAAAVQGALAAGMAAALERLRRLALFES